MGSGCVCKTLGGCSESRGGAKAVPREGIRCAPGPEVLGFAARGFLVSPHAAPHCLLAQPSGYTDLSVPSRWPLQDQPRAMGQLRKRQSSLSSLSSPYAGVWSECSALLLQGFTVHTSICLPPPFPLFPSLSFCRMLQGKRKFMEAVPRAVFPALVPVGACSWLAQPSLPSARLHNSFTSHKRWIMLPFTCCLPGPSPRSWWVHP